MITLFSRTRELEAQTEEFCDKVSEGALAFTALPQDEAGNVADGASFGVTTGSAVFDRSAPALASAVSDKKFYKEGDLVTITCTFTDAGSGALDAATDSATFMAAATDDTNYADDIPIYMGIRTP